MKIDENGNLTFDEAVFNRQSIREILNDGVVTEEEAMEQSERTKKLYDEMKASLSPEQLDKLNALMEEMGVLFTITLFHNFAQE